MKTKAGGAAVPRRSRLGKMKLYWQIYVLMAGGLLAYLIFRILPLWGLSLAFVDYNIVGGILNSPFAGLRHFTDLFTSEQFFVMLRNTLGISLLNLFVAFPAPILLALLLNEVKSERFKRLSQSIVYMPHFLSWPVLTGITFFLFSVDIGLWIVLLLQNVWRECGWGSIIYLAAISQIDTSFYEAATVDGATRMQKVLRITLPCLMPTIVVMFIMRLGTLLDVSFEQVLMMTNDFVTSVSEVFDTYTFRIGIQRGNYSIGTAVGLCKSVVGLCLVLASNWLVKKADGDGIY